MPRISVIVPVYNAFDYISRCMDSILNQTLKDIQIVCIDDGSTDGSGAILDKYADKDGRVQVIHKDNAGLVAARKTGVSAAESEYIGFVDADDYIDTDMFEHLYGLAQKYNVDLVSSGYVYEGKYKTFMKDGIPEGLYGGDKIDVVRERAIFNTEIHDVGLRGAVWSKLFRRDKLSEALCNVSDRLTYSEDKIIVMYYLLECSSVYIIHETYYHYLINANSMVNAENTNYLEAINEVYRAFIGMYPHAKFTRGMRLQAEMYVTEQLIKGINTRMGFENQNMMRIDPYWIEKIPMGTKVALCGAGEFGKIYRRILNTRRDIRYSGCLDEHPELFGDDNALGGILPLSSAASLEFDYIVITIKNPEKAGKVKNELEKYVSEKRILWFKQEEIYWRFAQANGLI